MYCKIMEKHPGYTLLDVLIRYLGKWLGRVVMIFWILYAVLAAVSLIFPSYTLFIFGFYLDLLCL